MMKINMKSLFYDIKKIRIFFRYPLWWYQRAKRGYSDRDMWSADIYLAGVFAGVLQWYIDNGIGVSMAYAADSDEYGKNVDDMVIRRNAEYSKHIAIFKEYSNNGLAFDESWKEKFGGVLDKDINASVHWLADHFTELWD
jgi:hypothetical protein